MLYCPCYKGYEILKGAVVGGPSLVFTRYHEVSVTRIRSHQFENAKLMMKILGYDANALYLSTMLKEVPCGNKKVVHYTDEWMVRAAPLLTQKLKDGT